MSCEALKCTKYVQDDERGPKAACVKTPICPTRLIMFTCWSILTLLTQLVGPCARCCGDWTWSVGVSVSRDNVPCRAPCQMSAQAHTARVNSFVRSLSLCGSDSLCDSPTCVPRLVSEQSCHIIHMAYSFACSCVRDVSHETLANSHRL